MNTTKNKIKFSYMLALLILLAGLQACTETWDSYYDQKSKTGDDLFTTIKATPDLKIFTRILEKSGYNNILSQSKSFTVFAPVDSVLESLDIETMDSISLAKIVENHVACSSVGTPSEGTLRVNMLNSKYVLFEKTGKKFYFGSFELASYDQLCANGILHKLAGEVPFAANMYQAMANDTSISTVYQYFKSYELKTYDLSKSV